MLSSGSRTLADALQEDKSRMSAATTSQFDSPGGLCMRAEVCCLVAGKKRRGYTKGKKKRYTTVKQAFLPLVADFRAAINLFPVFVICFTSDFAIWYGSTIFPATY